MKNLIEQFVSKSTEAFIMALEIYNKPTIRYRIEGFSFFICNAWELMLKAELLKRGTSIYYSDNPERTISLSESIAKIYPDKSTRIRLNLERIVDLRNISTHYITEDYEPKYVPLFQACVLNFVNEVKRFHGKSISDNISQSFLTISANYESLTNEQIKLKYPPEIAEKLIEKANSIEVLSEEYNSDKFSIDIRQNLYITKKRDEADFSVNINREGRASVAIVKELKDPADTHKYSYGTVCTAVKERLKKKNVRLSYKNGFTTHVLQLFLEFYNIKQDGKYAYEHMIGKTSQFTYSQQLVEFICREIEKDPLNFVESLKKGTKKR